LPKISAKFQPGHPLWGCYIDRGGVSSNWQFSTNISLYLRNGRRYKPS